MSLLKVIISGGGTGGHIFPAIAIANEIKKINNNAEILFIGALGKMEMEKIPQHGYDIKGLWISGINRNSIIKNLLLPIKLLYSLFKAKQILKSFKPNVVIGTGGFASGPLLKMANVVKCPTFIQEQNSYPGVTNKLLSKKAKKIFVAYNGMEKYFDKSKIILSGNPIRNEITYKLENKKIDALKYFNLKTNKQILLIVGGSLGALSINNSILEGIEKIIKNDIQVLWQTGKNSYNKIKTTLATKNISEVIIKKFITKIDYAYAVADIIVGRAGAIAISEFCAIGKPTILVPFQFATANHQLKNALELEKNNATIVVKDDEAKAKLISKIMDLSKDKNKQTLLSNEIKKMGKKDSASIIVNEVLKQIKL